MKTKILNTVLFSLLFAGEIFAQDVTTVRANNSDISDNLDLQAVASIFGDSRDLEDFERRINDPDAQISNLDLNGDNRVDYLRVIEVTENNTHVVILQSVLAVDTYQDVATIEVERDRNNNVTVQVVGDTYIYGPNYIYEPVYVVRPVMFNIFWVNTYRPYYSPWYYGYYPTYYNYWAPYPSYRYRNHVHAHVNVRNTYNYVNVRRSTRAVSLYNTRRADAYERQHPNQSFTSRNANVTNRHQLEQTRTSTRNANTLRNSTRNNIPAAGVRNNGNTVRKNGNGASFTGNNSAVRSNTAIPSVRNTTGNTTVRNNNTSTPSVRNNNSVSTPSVRNTSSNNSSVRSTSTPAVRSNNSMSTPSVRSNNNSSMSTPAVRSNNNSSMSTPTVRSNNNSSMSTPTVRSNNNSMSTPSVRSTPASSPSVRSSPAAAPQRQSAPAAPRSGGNGGGRRG